MQITSKELREKAQAYILDCINSEAYGVVTTTDQEKLQFLYDTFIKEYWYPYNEQRYHTKENAFREWIMGLPTPFSIDFSNYDIIQLAKSWGSIPANATEQQEDRIINNYFRFIANHTFQLFRKYKIKL